MSKSIRYRITAGLLCVALAGILGSCGGRQQPPAPKVRTAPPVQIPAPTSVENPNIFAYLKLREPNKLVDRLGDWTSLFQPGTNGAALRTILQSQGIALSDFRSGSHIGLFLFDPTANVMKPPMAGLFPIPYNSDTARQLAKAMGGDNITSVSENTIIARDQEGLAQAIKSADTLNALNKASMPTDLAFYLNSQALMDKYGPVLRQQIQTIQALMSLAKPQGKMDMAQMQRILGVEMQAALDALEQTKYLGFNLDMPAEALDFSLILKAKAGTGLEKGLMGGPVAAPELTQFLDKTAFVKTGQSVRDLGTLIDLYMKYLGMAVGPSQEAAMKQMKADLEPFKKIKDAHWSTSIAISPEGKMIYEGVMMTGDNDAMMKLIQEKMTVWINQGPLHDFYKGMGVEMMAKVNPKARKVRGWPVQVYEIQMTINQNMPAESRARIEKMFGNMAMEISQMGPYVLFTMGKPLDGLADRVFSEQGNEPIEAVRAYPPGGVLYVDFNLPALVNSMKGTMKPEEAARIPAFPAGTPPITGFGYHGEGMAYYRMMIPRALLGAASGQNVQPAAQNPPAQVGPTSGTAEQAPAGVPAAPEPKP